VEGNKNQRRLTMEDDADEAEKLLAVSKADQDATQENHDDREQEMIK
jgi:hypothetical protein